MHTLQRPIRMSVVAAVVLVAGLLAGSPVFATTQDITNQFSVTRSGLVLNRATNTYDSTVTLKNTSSTPVLAPIAAAVSGLPASVSLANAVGQTTDGKPYVSPTLPNSVLQMGATLAFTLKFSNPQRITFTSQLQILYTGDLPSDPGEAGKATVEGIDSNGNGVRDDIERWIGFSYPNSEKTRAALGAHAITLQTLVRAGITGDQSLALAGEQADADSFKCLYYVLGPSPRERVTNVTRTLFAEFMNTRDRTLAYDASGRLLAGKITDDTPNDGKAACRGFDPDTMGN